MEQNNSSEMTEINEVSLSQRLDALSLKIYKLHENIKILMNEKSFMENKISDAQGRIQKILNKLPQTADTRQLTLLDNSSEASNE